MTSHQHDIVHISFSCARCGAPNELTAMHLHEATMIHCSRCGAAVAPLGALARELETVPVLTPA